MIILSSENFSSAHPLHFPTMPSNVLNIAPDGEGIFASPALAMRIVYLRIVLGLTKNRFNFGNKGLQPFVIPRVL